VDEVRGVAQHDGALVEGFADEVDLAGGEVTDASVDELGGAAGGGLGEVAGFDECCAIAAGGGVEGYAEASGSASYDEDVIGVVEGGEGGAEGGHGRLVRVQVGLKADEEEKQIPFGNDSKDATTRSKTTATREILASQE